ncbi:lipoate-protein ligase A [Symbiobacterium terraclitae]|uniref:Lipoate-protein ligase A n=1 Tax=Symbiobacterium terraclitae TaxID=557451 RepID=A0ABS4JSB2_9FIRM|nr:lipoate--protein ligase family protein [Symbiobacterium terraclitae]MBP2018419.1 lipoate-protein ligase A [Symbiobacterium terraclitae]
MALAEKNWRLLDTGHRPGPENMAIDEAIARAHARGEVPPTLRFYGWAPPAVSIGYFQSMLKEVDLDAVRASGYGYVRRPTGGRLIFHHMELTYSVVVREELLPGGVIETYREISRGLLAGLAELGVAAELSGGERDPRRADPGGFHTACFDTASAYELQVGGRKLAGSAQTRRDGVILQHGSILLDVDVPLLFRLMRLPEGAPAERLMARFRSKATTLREALGREVGYAEARDAFTAGFARALGLRLTSGSLTLAEEKEAETLVATKYGSDNWNIKK